jgi:hypothetical protein
MQQNIVAGEISVDNAIDIDLDVVGYQMWGASRKQMNISSISTIRNAGKPVSGSR